MEYAQWPQTFIFEWYYTVYENIHVTLERFNLEKGYTLKVNQQLTGGN